MWLEICADPDCPNKRRIEELEQEIAKLKLALLRAQDDLKREQEMQKQPRFRYPD